MKKILVTALIMACSYAGFSQVYLTKSGYIGFFSKTPAEDIKAINNQVYAVIDAGKKNIAFTLLLKSFIFTKDLMQEHFNENYVESDKFPKASFSGAYVGDVIPNKDGTYSVTVKGNLTLHGVTKAIEAPATIEAKGNHLLGTTTFTITPEDYNIVIPSLVRGKIAQVITVNVKIDCTAKQ